VKTRALPYNTRHASRRASVRAERERLAQNALCQLICHVTRWPQRARPLPRRRSARARARRSGARSARAPRPRRMPPPLPQPVAPPGDGGWSDEEEPETPATSSSSEEAEETEEAEEAEEEWEEDETEESGEEGFEVSEVVPLAPLLFSLRVELGRGRSERRAPAAAAQQQRSAQPALRNGVACSLCMRCGRAHALTLRCSSRPSASSSARATRLLTWRGPSAQRTGCRRGALRLWRRCCARAWPRTGRSAPMTHTQRRERSAGSARRRRRAAATQQRTMPHRSARLLRPPWRPRRCRRAAAAPPPRHHRPKNRRPQRPATPRHHPPLLSVPRRLCRTIRTSMPAPSAARRCRPACPWRTASLTGARLHGEERGED
jgi:hypothetical protein